MAEYFRDYEGQDVLLFIDNIFRFTQAGSEVSALLGRIPSAVGYQPTLATDMGAMQVRGWVDAFCAPSKADTLRVAMLALGVEMISPGKDGGGMNSDRGCCDVVAEEHFVGRERHQAELCPELPM